MPSASKVRAAKPAKVVKPSKSRRRFTPHTKNHRFQSFTERISKLKIDPIRRRRNPGDHEELAEETATYFGRSLEEWRELNLSRTFTGFVRDVAPLCDSLAVLLHNEARIMDYLVDYIGRGDALAMEPLLALMSHFAHDLDVRFEKHFERAVTAITTVAAKHEDPAVIEWSFTCLAWLFKYLSRLLVADLRPLYDLMSPYLGKTSQKPFVIRFAAEALSFLLRKTAASYERSPESLDLITRHMLDDVVGSQDVRGDDLHRQGIMTLLTEAMKSVQGGVHSAGPAIIRSLLKASNVDDDRVVRSNIVLGAITSMIHHTSADTFAPLLDVVLEDLVDVTHLSSVANVLMVVASVRKGTRIQNWKPLTALLKITVEKTLDSSYQTDDATEAVLAALAVTFRYAPIEGLLPLVSTLDKVRTACSGDSFLQFCDLLARLSKERFDTFLLTHFQKFVLHQHDGLSIPTCRLIPHLAERGIELRLRPSDLQQASLVATATSISQDTLTDASIAFSALANVEVKENYKQTLGSALLGLVQSDYQSDQVRDFIMGPGLAYLLRYTDDLQSLKALWPVLCNHAAHLQHLPPFWSNLVHYMDKCNLDISSEPYLLTFKRLVASNLSGPSHDIRLASLEILQRLYMSQAQEVPDVIKAAIAIESTPANLETLRSISMNIRRLAMEYELASTDEITALATPMFCFGLLHVKVSQLWEDSLTAMTDMVKTTVGEQIIVDLAQRWLEATQEPREDGHNIVVFDENSSGFRVFSDFECSNFSLVSAITHQVFSEADSGYPSPKAQLETDLHTADTVPVNQREQALRVLHKIPQIAEKRSRMLVPVLLRWASNVELYEGDHTRWPRKDQKAMLAIFAQFTNPRVLFRSADVYAALLNLCANGDVEIQRSALQAIFAWKEAAVIRYQEHLLNLLDEQRFREEISVFLQDSDADDAIRPEDHPVLMPVLLRLLYGRAVAGGKLDAGARRKALFVALSGFGEDVLGMFIDIALNKVSKSDLNSDEIKAPLRQQLGTLNMLDDLLGTIGPDLLPFVETLMNASLRCTVSASSRIEANKDAEDASLLRAVRQVGVQCIVKIYESVGGADLDKAASTVTEHIISPRLDKFATENTQSVSGLLRLISVWATSASLASNLENNRILIQVAALLEEPSAKDEVRLFILREVLGSLVQDNIPASVLESSAPRFVSSIGAIILKQPSKDVLDASVEALVHLSHRIVDRSQANAIVEVCTGLLTKPSRAVSSSTKTNLLQALLPLIQEFDVTVDGPLFDAVCGLCSRLQTPKSRTIVSEVLIKLCRNNSDFLTAAELCADLNAQSNRLDEPDHDRRSRGYESIRHHAHTFSARQWLPIVHNCMFYIRDTDNMVNRSSASQALLGFAEAAERHGSGFEHIVGVLLVGIEFGIRDSSELVRAEFSHLLGRLAGSSHAWKAIEDLRALTVGGDDEASFFSNVLHIQQHRRLRALRRLSEQADSISSSNVSRFLLPLLEHFVFDQAEGDAGRTLADQTVASIGAIAKSLNWPAFRAVFKRYAGYISSKEDLEKTVLRLLGVLVDAINLPQNSKADVITRDFLPSLMGYLHHKDESTVDRRMPVAVTIVKLLLLLPEEETTARLPPVLTDIAHVLRSRSQEARDQARKTLSNILTLVGPAYLGFILKELRSALSRGYQLHVLSFTVHTLLVKVVESCEPGDLNHCLPDLTAIIMDDIFGATGQEKDAEEYKSSMKEVKSSKSFDTMELLARVTPIIKLGFLIKPVRSLLAEKLDSKTIKKADELLLRLRKGVDQNPEADSRDMLAFCHEIVRQVYAEQNAPIKKHKTEDYKVRKYVIQMESANKLKSRASTTAQMYKLVSFALNLVRRVVRRHEDLATPANIAGFLPMTGDALVQGQEEVKLAAARLLATLIKVPLDELDTNVPVYIKEAVAMMKSSGGSATDSAKAALELVTAILREKRSAKIRDSDMALMLKFIKTDIDEPDRQGITYRFLRAVVGRKVLIPEVYEVMDEVGKVVIMNPDRNVRESARSAYLQFIMDYPQSKDRWNKQAGFLVENLKYEHASGRQSVMELLHQLLQKLGDDVFEQLAFPIFVALVPVQVSDGDTTCRQMAGMLMTRLFERAEGEQLKTFISLMNKWLVNDKKPVIQVAAVQCWTTYLRGQTVPEKQKAGLRDSIVNMLDSEDVVVGAQLLSPIMELLSTMVEKTPETAFSGGSSSIWAAVQECLVATDLSIQETASTLMETYLSHLASASAKTNGLATLPLRGSYGASLDDEALRQLCRISLRVILKSPDITEGLAMQTARNLTFLARCFIANQMHWKLASASDDEESDTAETAAHDPSAIAFLLNRLSYIIRQDTLPAIARNAALAAQASILPHLSTIPHLTAFLRPLYTLVDPSIPAPQTEEHKSVVDRARELMDAVQKKIGADAYVAALAEVRSETKAVREERRRKRKIEAVNAPERYAANKKRQHEAARLKKKEKGAEMRGRRRGW